MNWDRMKSECGMWKWEVGMRKLEEKQKAKFFCFFRLPHSDFQIQNTFFLLPFSFNL